MIERSGGRRSGLHGRMSRRRALASIGSAAVGAALSACGDQGGRAGRVILYSSADDEILRGVVAAFEKSSGLEVGVVTDTEATKTTGLVQRLIEEKARPRADVWWSSEPLGTIRLAREGVLGEHTPGPAAEGRPGPLNVRHRWFVMSGRARVIAYSTSRVAQADVPDRVLRFAGARRHGAGMARPQFGTTRCHMAFLLDRMGRQAFAAWLNGLKNESEIRLYDGNASVVRAIAQGEIDTGLTDTDDVLAAQRNGWSVGMVLEGIEDSGTPDPSAPKMGTLVLPNTAGLVARGPNPAGGAALLDFLLGEQAERMLVAGESRHAPLRASVVREFPQNQIATPATVDFERVADAVGEAMSVCEQVLGA